jgi:serine/threonine protein kinase
MSGQVDSDADTVDGGARVGQVIAGKYRLERLLGRGGMGKVYEARHVVVGRRFAVKLLHADVAKGSSALSRFEREARAAGSLESRHIAAVVDFATTAEGHPFLVMEYLTGVNLAQLLLAEGPLAVPRCVELLQQVCRGLEAAHQAGIVHRDLKPDNLLVTKNDDGSELVKILDFGIAKLAGEPSAALTRSGAVLGTPFYMAPEQARGEKSVDFRVDLYALGVIAYELLSGKKPHPGDSYNAILAHILTQRVEPLAALRPGLPAALVALIEAAMAPEPAARPSSAAAWAGALGAFAAAAAPTKSADQFDLRPVAASAYDGATLAAQPTAAVEPAGNTLQSAVGEVSSVRGRAPAERVRYALVGLAALGVAAFALLKAAPRSSGTAASSSAVAVASSGSGGQALPTEATATPPLGSTPPPLVSAPARAVASVKARAMAPPPQPSQPGPVPPTGRTAGRPSSSASAPAVPATSSSARTVSFDDKNPY